MNRETVESINRVIYKRFPEVNGKTPQVKLQETNGTRSSNDSTYLMIYSGLVVTADDKKMMRKIRVVASGNGKIIKITTSR